MDPPLIAAGDVTAALVVAVHTDAAVVASSAVTVPASSPTTSVAFTVSTAGGEWTAAASVWDQTGAPVTSFRARTVP